MDNPSLRPAMARRLYRRAVATGSIVLPAVPGMIDDYVTMCDRVFTGLGAPFNAEHHQAMAMQERSTSR